MAGLRIAIAQLNPIVGDLTGNASRVLTAIDEAHAADCDLIAFPEMVLTGYPPGDLLALPTFTSDNLAVLDHVAAATRDMVALVGFVDRSADGKSLFSAVAACARGAIVGIDRKRCLVNDAGFDEQRHFSKSSDPLCLLAVNELKVGVSISENTWDCGEPLGDLAAAGADLIVNITASTYRRGKAAFRQRQLSDFVRELGTTVAYVNMVGGQDDLVFDGASLVLDPTGSVVARAPQFRESLLTVDLELSPRLHSGAPAEIPIIETLNASNNGPRNHTVLGTNPENRLVSTVQANTAETTDGPELRPEGSSSNSPIIAPVFDPIEEIYEALVLATRDYVVKNGFTDVVIGLSAGVDSSLVAAIAVDALGKDHVHGVLMPSRFSSDGSITDAVDLATNLEIDHRTISIEPAHAAFLDMLEPWFAGREPDLTEENIQPRIRGMLLMALSNKFGWLVLTTGNKSETAVGYSTLYGDTAGGFAVIKDAPKLDVYELCRFRNAQAGRDLIPEAVLTKAPSAELRPDQRDDQSLPPYEVLDPILEQYVEFNKTVDDLIEQGFDADLVKRIVRMVDLAEYKRRQSPPGPRISSRSFGQDRQYPITNRYR